MRYSKCFFLVSVLAFSLHGADWYADYEHGKKGAPGTKDSPVENFAAAMAKAKPGDSVYILPASNPIRDTLVVRQRKGEPGKPITVDGMNNIFTGARPLDSEKWIEFKPGYFHKIQKQAPSMVARYFMVRNGRHHRMGRFTKASGAAKFKKVDDLLPGEWTIVDKEPSNRQKHDFEFVLRLPEGAKTAAEAGFEEPVLVNGVDITGWCSEKTCGHAQNDKNGKRIVCGRNCEHIHCGYIHFKNIIVRHFWNDGFNIHGNVRQVHFNNIAAVECGDDGISAHEAAILYVRNYVSLRNSTGICHIMEAEAYHDNVYIEGTLGSEFLPCDKTIQELTNAAISGGSSRGIQIANQDGSIRLADCLIDNPIPGSLFRVNQGKAKIEFKNVRTHGYKQLPEFSGLTIEKDHAALKQAIAAKRQELFALFNGQLEKAAGK